MCRSLYRSLFHRIRIAAALAIALAASAAWAAPPANPPIVLHGGQIFTGDPARPWAQAIAVAGGVVVAVGSDADVLAAAPSATRIPLGGRVVIPGFNDAHVHVVIPEGNYLNTPDFLPGPGPTLTEVKALLTAGAASAAPGSWLFAFIGASIFDDAQATRFALDTVTPDHPVALFGWTGHGIWINTKAMSVLGISPTQPDPFGGHFRRFPKSDVITGEVHEYAEFDLRRRMLAVVPDVKIIARYQAFAATAVQLGYTSLQDMAVGLPHSRTIAVLRAAKLPLRVRAICFPMTPGELCDLTTGGDDDPVRAAGVKWITDGTPVERLSFVNIPYADRPDQVGEPDLSVAALRDQLNAHKTGPAARHQLLFHAVGDAAIDDIFDAMLTTGGAATWHARRTRIEHGEMLFAGERDIARDLGVVVVQNPTHFALAPVFAQRFIPEVFGQLEPMQSLLAEGIPLAIGTDGIGAPQSPFLNLFLAMIHPTHPSEALTLEQALVAFTRGSAYAEFQDGHKGTLAPGRAADLAVLSQDIFHIAPPDIPATTSLLTVVAGRIVWDAGVLHPAP
ncbi:MAG TPA: amidohydrolase family protein [Kofleriaceae bacterium]|nr:amidohydrolase family protein [Kofleriaceae bacterium]